MVKYSQNFLVDLNIRNRIIEISDLKRSETVLEVGPGRGILTEKLIKKCAHLIAIEKDAELANQLQKRFPSADIYHQDVLDADFDQFSIQKIVSNLPYQITKPFLVKFLFSSIPEAFCMVQKEVSDKLLDTHPLTYFVAAIQSVFHIESLLSVKRTCFSPRPNVDSAVISLKREKSHSKEFFVILEKAFREKRKMLTTSLSHFAQKERIALELMKLELPKTARPQDLTIQELETLMIELGLAE